MVICSKCQSKVIEGKFCTNCGAPLSVENKPKIAYCTNCGAKIKDGDKFCTKCGKSVNIQDTTSQANSKSKRSINVEGFFKNLGTGISNKTNNIVTTLFTIKSDYKNNKLIYYVEKIPKIKEKRIEINGKETVLIDFGNGYQKQNTTFTTQNENFTCIYYENNFEIPSINIKIPLRLKVKRVQNEDELQVNIEIITQARVENVESFVINLLGIKKMSWTFDDIINIFNNEINQELSEKLNDIYKNENGIILKNSIAQIKNYNSDISRIISKKLSKFFINVVTSEIKNVDFNKVEANKILIKELYKQ